MSQKIDETASFVLRFTQKIFEDEQGESQVQWRGNIRHVQGGEEKRFSEFDDVVEFIQTKLADLTIQAMKDKSPEEQKGILSKSYDLWKRMAAAYPKIVMDTIKDPKKQVSQIREQITHVGETIGQKLEIDTWRTSTKSDFKEIMNTLEQLTENLAVLNKKVDEISNQNK